MELPRRRVYKILWALSFLLCSILGVFLAYSLYLVNEERPAGSGWFRFSWSEVSDYSPLVAVAIGVVSAAIMSLWLILELSNSRSIRFRFVITAISFVWIGFGFGLTAPAILGIPPSFSSPENVTSAIYDLRIDEVQVNPELQKFSESVRPGPFLASNPSSNEVWAAINSPATIIFGENTEVDVGQVAIAKATSLSQAGFDEWLNVTELNPRIQHVRDIQYYDEQLLVSNVEYKKEGCLELQVWALFPSDLDIVRGDTELLWSSEPCLRWDMGTGGEIGRHTSGGRIAEDPDGGILLSVGDFRIGASIELDYAGRPELLGEGTPFGKLIEIQSNGDWAEISRGHRNPQGLIVDSLTGSILMTEHGPRGGGELNLIEMGADYGWPDVTYGAPYNRGNLPNADWDFDRWNSSHEGFEKPLLSWMPSIAPSQLIRYVGDELSGWNGDLLIAALADESLRRIRMDGSRVITDERIEIGERIRDILQLRDGKILMSYDNGKIALLSLAR